MLLVFAKLVIIINIQKLEAEKESVNWIKEILKILEILEIKKSF